MSKPFTTLVEFTEQQVAELRDKLKLTIKVGQRHIDKGRKCISHSCPIALAIAEHLKDATYVSVSDETIFINYHGHEATYQTPIIAANFIKDFDASEKVEPFEFELEVE